MYMYSYNILPYLFICLFVYLFIYLSTCLLQVVNSTILQQVFVVEFVVQNQMCDACHRQAAQDYWKAVVQVRQKVQSNSWSII